MTRIDSTPNLSVTSELRLELLRLWCHTGCIHVGLYDLLLDFLCQIFGSLLVQLSGFERSQLLVRGGDVEELEPADLTVALGREEEMVRLSVCLQQLLLCVQRLRATTTDVVVQSCKACCGARLLGVSTWHLKAFKQQHVILQIALRRVLAHRRQLTCSWEDKLHAHGLVVEEHVRVELLRPASTTCRLQVALFRRGFGSTAHRVAPSRLLSLNANGRLAELL